MEESPLHKNKVPMPDKIETEDETKNMVKKGNGFFNWMMEYSKKIISITFIIYIVINIFILVMTVWEFKATNQFQCLDTLITEMHTTFREVIGGYIIKAAVENVSKYSGTIVEKWLDLRLEKELNKRIANSEIIEKDGLTWAKVK